MGQQMVKDDQKQLKEKCIVPYSSRELGVGGEDVLWKALKACSKAKAQSFTRVLSSPSCQQFYSDGLLIDIEALNSWRHRILTDDFGAFAFLSWSSFL